MGAKNRGAFALIFLMAECVILKYPYWLNICTGISLLDEYVCTGTSLLAAYFVLTRTSLLAAYFYSPHTLPALFFLVLSLLSSFTNPPSLPRFSLLPFFFHEFLPSFLPSSFLLAYLPSLCHNFPPSFPSFPFLPSFLPSSATFFAPIEQGCNCKGDHQRPAHLITR